MHSALSWDKRILSALPKTRERHDLHAASLANRVARLQPCEVVTIKMYPVGKASQTSTLEQEMLTGNNVFAGYLMYGSSHRP